MLTAVGEGAFFSSVAFGEEPASVGFVGEAIAIVHHARSEIDAEGSQAEAKPTMLALLITQPETWCGPERQRVLHTKDPASQRQLHVVDERVLGCVLNTKTRHGCTRAAKTSTLRLARCAPWWLRLENQASELDSRLSARVFAPKPGSAMRVITRRPVHAFLFGQPAAFRWLDTSPF